MGTNKVLLRFSFSVGILLVVSKPSIIVVPISGMRDVTLLSIWFVATTNTCPSVVQPISTSSVSQPWNLGTSRKSATVGRNLAGGVSYLAPVIPYHTTPHAKICRREDVAVPDANLFRDGLPGFFEARLEGRRLLRSCTIDGGPFLTLYVSS